MLFLVSMWSHEPLPLLLPSPNLRIVHWIPVITNCKVFSFVFVPYSSLFFIIYHRIAMQKKRLIALINHYIKAFRLWLWTFPQYEKGMIVWLVVHTLIALFFPLMSVWSLQWTTEQSFFLFFPWTYADGLLSKIFFLLLLTHLLLRFWHAHPKAKQFLSTLIGFRENPYLLSGWLLWIIIVLLLGINDSVLFVTTYTSTVSLSLGYYLVLVSTIFLLCYSLYGAYVQSKSYTYQVPVPRSDSASSIARMQEIDSLFDKMKHDE